MVISDLFAELFLYIARHFLVITEFKMVSKISADLWELLSMTAEEFSMVIYDSCSLSANVHEI